MVIKCNHRYLTEKLFSGKSGKRFVRMQSNAVERWYPLLREGSLRPDSCSLCGYSWKDHLEYWSHCHSRKRGASEFDRYCMEKSGTQEGLHEKYARDVESKLREWDDSRRLKSHSKGEKKKLPPTWWLIFVHWNLATKVLDLAWLNDIDSSRMKKNVRTPPFTR